MDKEIDIIEMIKSRRFFKMAIHKLLSDKDRMELKERTRYIMIDPDSSEDIQKGFRKSRQLEAADLSTLKRTFKTGRLDLQAKE